jgi:uncharacterized phage protein (TIGR01671 family)
MREIKFRIWSERDNKYLCYAPLQTLVDGKDKTVTLKQNEIILEQFTGLFDKNGVEIFEGDIVILHQFLFDGGEYEKQLIGQVVADLENACYSLTNIKQEQIQEYMGYKDDYTEFQKECVPINLFYGLHEDSFEVIGNIHEKESE